MATIFEESVPPTTLFIPKSSGQWSIDGLVASTDYSNVLLLAFTLQDSEIIDVQKCFNDTTHIFAFGRQEAVLQVSFLLLLHPNCPKQNLATPDDLRNSYNKCRIYKHNDPLKIDINSELQANGFLIDMKIGDVNPENHTCIVTFTFLLDQEA